MPVNHYSNPVLEEISQAKARIFFSALISFYVIFLPYLSLQAIDFSTQAQLLVLSSLAMAYSIILIVVLKPDSRFVPIRQVLSITIDITFFSYASYVAGEWATIAFSLFLWVIVGNGIRFGLFYLTYAMLLTVACFTLIISTHPFWLANQSIGIGILISFFLLPLFFYTLIERLHEVKFQLEAELEMASYLANHDALTGLQNHDYFKKSLHNEIARAKRNHEFFSIIFINLIQFKAINNTHGYDIGDKVLLEIANRIKQSMREIDSVARFNCDEFICLTATEKTQAGTISLKNRILNHIQEPIIIDNLTINVSANIGESHYPENGQSIDSLVKAAEKDMNTQKSISKIRHSS